MQFSDITLSLGQTRLGPNTTARFAAVILFRSLRSVTWNIRQFKYIFSFDGEHNINKVDFDNNRNEALHTLKGGDKPTNDKNCTRYLSTA